jgi:hypothetical protein
MNNFEKIHEMVEAGYEIEDDDYNWFGVRKIKNGYAVFRNGNKIAQVKTINQCIKVLNKDGVLNEN